MMLVFKCFATFSALEFTIAARLRDVSLSDEGGEGSPSEIHNENTTFELPLIHVTMSLINRGQKFMFIYHVWKRAAKEAGLGFHVRLHNLESLRHD